MEHDGSCKAGVAGTTPRYSMASRLSSIFLLIVCTPHVRTQALPFSFTYQVSGETLNVHGLEPSSASDAPVYLLASSGGRSAPEFKSVQDMAARGFVSASIEMPTALLTCPSLEAASQQMFSYAGAADTAATSALAKICGRIGVNCDGGVAVHGFSMGGLLAGLAARWSPAVSAVLLEGAGNRVPGTPGETKAGQPGVVGGSTLLCLQDLALSTYVPRSARRFILGQRDEYYGGMGEHGAAAQARLSSGYDCGANIDCFQPDGSGYYVPDITHVTLASQANHAAASWSLMPSLTWLARAAVSYIQTSPPPPPPPTPFQYVPPPIGPQAPSLPPSCHTVATQHAFVQHCASTADCTSDDDFCACCREYGRRTEWAEACSGICGVNPFALTPPIAFGADVSWRMDDFGRSALPTGPNTELGPYFEQPALSLVGDAAVVLGDCYNVELRSTQLLDRAGNEIGTEACLLPPVVPRKFESDSLLRLNLSTCPSTIAPFHVHDHQPAAIAAMICFDECHVRNMTTPAVPPPVVDHDALFIANCTRRCFHSCVRPIASECSALCPPSNYTCFGECHLHAETCSIPMGVRDTRLFRQDANSLVCRHHYQGYEDCVRECTDGCHDTLRLSKRTVHDDIHDWYNTTCNPPLNSGALLAAECMINCQDNCTSTCNATVSYPLGPAYGYGPALSNCTRECTQHCIDNVCFTADAVYEFEEPCRPPPAYNCSSHCYGEHCVPLATFCSVYNSNGDLRHVDPNCTGAANVTYQSQWGDTSINASVADMLANPSSALSLYVSVNSTMHICYNDCRDAGEYSADELFFHGSVLRPSRNCTTLCYLRTCIDECESNCTAEYEYSILPSCPRELAGTDECLTPSNCSIARTWGNCSSHKTFEPLLINITEVTQDVTVWVPPWNISVCSDLIDDMVGGFRTCVSTCPTLCDEICPLPANVTLIGGYAVINGATDAQIDSTRHLVNDTSGLCLQQCHANCTTNCSNETSAEVSTTWCKTPSEPIDWCTPPSNCTSDCSHECLDPTLLYATDADCEATEGMKNPDGTNTSVISLPLSFNSSAPPQCSRNATGGNCSTELLYYNVTEHVRNVYVTEGCIRRCFDRCVARCFERYCVTRLEEPVNDTAVCLPRCLDRFFEEPAEGLDLGNNGASPSSGLSTSLGSNSNYTACYGSQCFANITTCQLMCDADCLIVRSANCSTLCEHLVNPTIWQGCLAGCLANASAICARDCVYSCTSNHTLAYGYRAPYDNTADYLSFSELYAEAELHMADFTSLGPWSYVWSNRSRDCHANCTLQCAQGCFQRQVDDCDADEMSARQVRIDQGLPPEHPRAVALAYNNCTLSRSAGCITGCRQGCTTGCANLTVEVPRSVIIDQHLARVYDEYVEHCESSCRLSIYGRNTTRGEECLVFTPTFSQDCMANCTNEARNSCSNFTDPTQSIDIGLLCNNTCVYLYIDPASLIVSNATGGTATDGALPLDMPPPPPPPLPGTEAGNINWAYDGCMETCQGNYTGDPQYLCDGGVKRARYSVLAAEYYIQAEQGMGLQGITPQEQMEIDRLNSLIPLGEVCYFVNLECVANATIICEETCASQMAYYHQLCVFRETQRRNATFDYNISSCIHPTGWRIGQEKWRYWETVNASSELATRRYHRGDPLFEYEDVEDQAILNCTCTFLNETYDPHFVAAVLEYEMRPTAQNTFLSTCLCLFNESAQLPEHCVQSNFSDIMNIYDWVFGNSSLAIAPPDYVLEHSQEVAGCASGCFMQCIHHCGAYFVEHITPDDARWNGSTYLHLLNETYRRSGYPLSLDDWNQTQADGTFLVTPGHWRGEPTCFPACFETCALTNCTADCIDGCGDSVEGGNETAQAFGCFWNATIDEGRPLCGLFCTCNSHCNARCLQDLPMFNTSVQMLEYLPTCFGNCSLDCQDEHTERCYNISAMIAAANRPRYVNRTAVCLANIWPTCTFHCSGISVRNTTVNTTLFPASFLPSPLLRLNVTAGFDPDADEGYNCVIEPCIANMPCNYTAIQIGEELVIDEESGNRTIVPIMQNVTTISYESCLVNRSSSCMSTCSEVGYLVCVPEIDPFDLCVQSCVANLTYLEPAYQLDQTLAVCKKKLRLTPSQSSRRGAAWYRDKQHVRGGFRTTFAFKMNHQSKRCATVAHPSHEEKPELHDMLCSGRGGDGFAFVVQDAGATAYDADCSHRTVADCVDGEALVCKNMCKSLCPATVGALHYSCAASCLAKTPYVFPRLAAASDGGGLLATAAASAASSCAAHVGTCVSACDGSPNQLTSGAAMAPGGCLRTCLDAGARSYCEARCPLVDEDLDMACINACSDRRSAESASCYTGCSNSCTAQVSLEQASCELKCNDDDALMPSGETVGRCRQAALAHPVHDTALCLTSCRHSDTPCLRKCSERPVEVLANCVGACPQNNTRCVTECIVGRERLGRDCIYPRIVRCNHTSVAIGEGAEGVGYGALRNTLAVKFDTWYNAEKADPWLYHIGVHSGGFDGGAPTMSTSALGLAYDMPDLNDGLYHEALVEYTPDFDGSHGADGIELSITPAVAARMNTNQRGGLRYIGILSVHLDGRRVLRIPINLEELLTLDSGRAYVGFTGATGAAYQEHSIINWRFNESKTGALHEPANLHCRQRVPSLWHATGYDGSPILPARQALACTPTVMEPATPTGAMHSLRCREDPVTSVVYCQDPNMRNVPPIVHDPLPDVSTLVGTPVNHTLPEAFLDHQSDGRFNASLLSYSVSHDAVPELAWLQFDAPGRRLYGTPTRPGTWPITVTATDPGFREGADPPMTNTSTFLLHVRDLPLLPQEAGTRAIQADVRGMYGPYEAAERRVNIDAEGAVA